MHKLSSKPAADGFRMPAEFEPHQGTLLIWPWRPGSWQNGGRDIKEIYVKLCRKLAEKENLYLIARPEDYIESKCYLLTGNPVIDQRMHFLIGENEDAWARDTGATFVVNDKGSRRGIDWEFNAWGGTYDGLYAHWEHDQEIPKIICDFVGDILYDARHFVLEGGSIHTDGEGTLLTTEECLLSPGRNPSMTKEEIEQNLKDYLGVEKIIWLPFGIYNDETNGHIDNMCCFTAPGEVLLAWTDDPSDPQYERSVAALKVLEETTDARGRKIKVRKLPIPSPICIEEADVEGYDFEEGEDTREVGERLAASYVNFYIANHCILLPQFDDPGDEAAVKLLQECFPNREIVPVSARAILTGGGNIHCITQQIPAKHKR